MAVSIVTACNVVLAVAIQFYIVLRFGAGVDTDAHVASQTIPVLASSVLVATLPQVIVPILVAESDPRAAAWSVILKLAVVAIPLVLLLTTTAAFWVPVLFVGLDDTTLSTATTLTQIQMGSVLASALLSAPLALLYSARRVLASESMFLVASVTTLVALPQMSTAFGIAGASTTLTIRAFLQLVLILPFVGRPTFRATSPDLGGKLWRQARPLLIGAPIYKLGPVVDRLLGSFAPTGQLTLLIYGQQAWGLGLALLDRIVAKPFLADHSMMSFAGRGRGVRALYLKRLRTSLVASTLGFVAFCIIGEHALRAIAELTRLSPSDATELYVLCVVLGGVFIAGSAGQVSLAAVYGMGDTRAVTRIAVVTFIVASLSKLALMPALGIYGIAAGAVLYQTANAIALHRRAMREVV